MIFTPEELKTTLDLFENSCLYTISQSVINIIHNEIDVLALKTKHSNFNNVSDFQRAQARRHTLQDLALSIGTARSESILAAYETLSYTSKVAIRTVILNELARKNATTPQALNESLSGWREYGSKPNPIDTRPRNIDGSLDKRFKQNRGPHR